MARQHKRSKQTFQIKPGRMFLSIVVLTLSAVLIQCENPLVEKIAQEAAKNLILTVTNSGNGSTDPSGTVEVPRGKEVSITATPAGGYQFSEWSLVSGSGVSFGHTAAAATTVKLDRENATIRAVFIGAKSINVRDQDGNRDLPSGGVLDFGSGIIVGSPKEILCRIENNGQAVLTLAGLPMIGPLENQYDHTAFSFNILPSLAVLPGSYSNFSIVFDPSEFREYTGLLVIYSDDPNHGTYTIKLRGSGSDTPIPDMHIRSSSEDIPSTDPHYEFFFGDTLVDSEKTVNFTLENKGTAPLNLSASPELVNLGGADAPLFSVTAQPAGNIAPDASTTFTVRFSPTLVGGTGTKTVVVSIYSNDPNENPYQFSIMANAVTPVINLRQGSTDLPVGSSFDYRYRVLNEPYDVVFTIENTGTAPLVRTAPVQLAGSTRFAVASQPAETIPAGESSNFTVAFTPVMYDEVSATVSIQSSDLTKSTYSFNVLGKGTVRLTPVIDTYDHNTVSMSPDVLVVGSSSEYVDYYSQGAAYIFYRSQGGTNSWGQKKKLTAYDGAYQDWYGTSTGISGSILAVGAPGYNADPVINAGSVYIYSRDQGGSDNWGLQKHLLPYDPYLGNFRFGYSVALDGDVLTVGAPNGGRVFVFYRNNEGTDNWGPQATFSQATNTLFGHSMDLAGDMLAVGAPLSYNEHSQAGRVHLHSRNQGGIDAWGLLKTITPDDPSESAKFGTSVALDGDFLIVGAGGAGAAYVFARDQGGTGNWGQIARLVPGSGPGGGFGDSVTVMDYGTTARAIVGASNTNHAYLFHFNGSSWSEYGIADLGRGVAMNEDSAVICGTNRAYVIQH